VVISGPYAFYDAGKIVRVTSYINYIAISLDQLFRRACNKGGALWGSNFAVRRKALLAVGGFDTSIKFYGEEYELSLRLRQAGKGKIEPGLFVLTSARRLKRLGFVTQYWNWTVDYFSILFWHRPLPERLEDWPSRAWRDLATGFSRRKLGTFVKYIGVLVCVVWLNTTPVLETFRKLVYLVDIAGLGAWFAYHGIHPVSQLYGNVYSNGNRNQRQVALSFDDGPSPAYTPQVLNLLAQYGIKATFFVIGQNVYRYPGVCREVSAAGHVIGNHSYYHRKSLCWKGGKVAAREVLRTSEAIFQSTGVEVKLFRPPHGFRTPWLMHTLRRLGYAVVTWDNMTDDWEANKPAADIVEAIVKRTKPGSIIVLHDGRSHHDGYDRSQMLLALPRIIETLRDRGFDFVTVPQVLQLEDRSREMIPS
jgi:peptidoglycan/xylan/chitin deacetylase (PgdA/CDA1 family)